MVEQIEKDLNLTSESVWSRWKENYFCTVHNTSDIIASNSDISYLELVQVPYVGVSVL